MERSPDDLPRFERIVEACADALERVLGAPAGCLQRASREELAQWLAPPSGQKEEQPVQPQEHLPRDTAAGKQFFTELMDKVKESK
jgi:hypothetical protein